MLFGIFLRLHIIFVTKYQRKVFTGQMLKYAEKTFAGILKDWRCSLIEFGGEEDHVHLLADIHPALTYQRWLTISSPQALRNCAVYLPTGLKSFTGNQYSGIEHTMSEVSAM